MGLINVNVEQSCIIAKHSKECARWCSGSANACSLDDSIMTQDSVLEIDFKEVVRWPDG